MASAWWTFVSMEEHAQLTWTLIGATVQVDFKENIVKVIEEKLHAAIQFLENGLESLTPPPPKKKHTHTNKKNSIYGLELWCKLQIAQKKLNPRNICQRMKICRVFLFKI